MAKKFVWYEVIDVTANGLRNPKENYWLDDYCKPDASIIGRYSTKENAITRLKKWAEQKGIPFEKNIYLEDHPFSKEPIIHVGVYYSIKDESVKYTDDWAYASEAIIMENEMELDQDI